MGEFRMPSLGADMKAATLVEWHVKEGAHVRRGDIIADVETEKGDIDVEVYEEGTLEKILVQPGEKLPVGTLMAYVRSEGEPSWEQLQTKQGESILKASSEAAQPELSEGTASVSTETKSTPKVETDLIQSLESEERIKASPLAKMIATENHIDLHEVQGTRPNGAIGRADVERYMHQKTDKAPAEQPERSLQAPATTMRKAIANAMAKSNREIPHYYLDTHIDMSHALEWMEAENRNRPVKERLLNSVLLIKAVALALTEVPELNGYWIDNELKIQEAIHIGFAIALRRGGLITPAIHHADTKSLDELMENLKDLTQRTREGRLRSSELSDATITLTSLGDRGVETVYGVIYPPQVALIGFGKILDQVWVAQGMLGIRPLVHATLAADHRASDGHQGARFLDALSHYLQDIPQLLN
ncbi:pyruvate dehydrogenase E2 component (dihydrolipoamide acetyltransferase) [Catalinimonas alkaloidigena]|uniref:dihydrolipoamide acetyltransferase family protein n=1 Tax=Catalinimonas alkaloidigena TaxID=1075417 RepID=UPI002405E2A7|nr:dihydrolipoamide acetyltransferase family protein [Catalinimonas alkaloidigena]MDF9797858.1 pyruvate dehydrogenase E2 component (dihydrolipoamide acetyltransferase) [Catalinimonas alkaloidigena]